MFLPLASLQVNDPMVVVVLGLIALVPVINGVLSIIRHFKSDPPAHHYALKQDVDKDLEVLEARINARIAVELTSINKSITSMEKDITSMTKTLTSELKEMNRAIGKLEGQD